MYIFKYFSSILKLLSADTIETVQTVHVYITLQSDCTRVHHSTVFSDKTWYNLQRRPSPDYLSKKLFQIVCLGNF